jgi:hypothetical protein
MALTKLQAVNSIIRGIGLQPVAALDNSDLDAAIAEQTLDQVSEEIQGRGWWFNKSYNWRIAPDAVTGEIEVASNITSAVPYRNSRNLSLSIIDGKLYDDYEHTNDLSALTYEYEGQNVIDLILVFEIGFEELPTPARTAIMYVARRQFAMDMELDQARWKFQMQDEEKAMALMQREDAKNNKRNYLYNNVEAQTFLSRVAGRNSVTRALQVFPKRETY